jgi:hypothetical protein
LPASTQGKCQTVQTVAHALEKQITEQVEKLIENGHEIPSLNIHGVSDLLEQGSRLVKFVGMVQDNSLPPELFSELFYIKENNQEVI